MTVWGSQIGAFLLGTVTVHSLEKKRRQQLVFLDERWDGRGICRRAGWGGQAHDSLGVPDRRIPTRHGYSAFFGEEEKTTTGILAIQEVE